jgi:hypothetical protein
VPTAAAVKVILDYAYPRQAEEPEGVVEPEPEPVETEPYPSPLAPTPLGDSAPLAPR